MNYDSLSLLLQQADRSTYLASQRMTRGMSGICTLRGSLVVSQERAKGSRTFSCYAGKLEDSFRKRTFGLSGVCKNI